MPKAPKTKQRHDPLHADITNGDGLLKARPSKRAPRERDEEANENYVDAGLSRKILAMARAQQKEIEAEERAELAARGIDSDDDWEDDEEVEYVEDEDFEDDEEFEAYHEDIEELEVDPEEEALFNRYMGRGDDDGEEPQMTLADKIMAKVREKEMEMSGTGGPKQQQDEEQVGVMLPPKVIEVYEKVGELLSRYRSGKLPKVFKMIPSLKHWQDVLYVTQPESWSPNALYEATRLFVSNLKAEQCQSFVQDVLLERFREEVQSSKTVNYHTYRALKKALYKPAAFFKGFLFPLCESGTCTLKEAVIVGSVLTKVSIPVLHSAVALMKLAEMEYAGPTSLFIKILLDKKYALPYKVVDAVVFHFIRFRTHQGTLPVVWHQSFLVFAQRYKNDITPDQRDALLDVVREQFHHSMGAEIRRELISGAPRGAIVDVEMK
uniref:ARAD1A02398p n=1 Tax=Blastobotrys adeninivorans TaxID=409370 RepID=A0A060SW63_BLAAD